MIVRVALGASIGALLAGCSSATTAESPLATPTPTHAPSALLGGLTAPIPANVQSVTVTITRAVGTAATSADTTLFQKTVTDAGLVKRIVADVDELHVDSGATQGCADYPANLRLDFVTATSMATLSEDSSCFRSTLTTAGVPGPLLDSALLSQIETLLGIQVGFDTEGNPSVS